MTAHELRYSLAGRPVSWARTYDRMKRDAVVVEVTDKSMRKGAW